MIALSGANTGEFLAGHEHSPFPPTPPPFIAMAAEKPPPAVLLDDPAKGG